MVFMFLRVFLLCLHGRESSCFERRERKGEKRQGEGEIHKQEGKERWGGEDMKRGRKEEGFIL